MVVLAVAVVVMAVVVVVVPVLMMVIVRVVVPVLARRRARATHARAHDRGAHAEHQQPGDEVEPWVQVLGEHVRRQPECHRPQGEDADRVRDRHGQPECNGMARRAARSDQVRRHHRLAVAGRQGVDRAPAEGREQEHQEHALAGGRALEDPAEAVARPAIRRRRAGAAIAAGAVTVPAAGVTRRCAPCGWPGSPAARWGRRAAAGSGQRSCVAAHGRPTAGLASDPRQPTRPERWRRAQRHATGRHPSAQRHFDSRRLQPAGAARDDRRPPGRMASATGRPPTVSVTPRATSARFRSSTRAGAPRSRKVGISAWSST